MLVICVISWTRWVEENMKKIQTTLVKQSSALNICGLK